MGNRVDETLVENAQHVYIGDDCRQNEQLLAGERAFERAPPALEASYEADGRVDALLNLSMAATASPRGR